MDYSTALGPQPVLWAWTYVHAPWLAAVIEVAPVTLYNDAAVCPYNGKLNHFKSRSVSFITMDPKPKKIGDGPSAKPLCQRGRRIASGGTMDCL
jgi:hypothetical protein